ncbi:DUF86 domain-containing protein [Alicyclobacillus curvatus]|nr:DUF86 domain-containing protein [Alicyclobacillus curvatus]
METEFSDSACTLSKNIDMEGAIRVFVTAELRASVQKNLAKVDECSYWLEQNGAQVEDNLTLKLAAERALHVAIECATDAANLVIDALVMREPGGYADIIRVLMEESVVSRDWFAAFESALEFRNRLVHRYADMTFEEVREAAVTYGPLLPAYSEALRTYLDIV